LARPVIQQFSAKSEERSLSVDSNATGGCDNKSSPYKFGATKNRNRAISCVSRKLINLESGFSLG